MRIPKLFKPNGKRPPPRSTADPAGFSAARVPPLTLVSQALARLRAPDGARPPDGSALSESAPFTRAMPSRAVSLLMVNLDRFKLINDLCGPATGDFLIDIVHERCRRVLRRSHVIHLGADEFACFLPEGRPGAASGITASDIPAERLAAQLLKAIGEPVSLGRHMVHLTASIGIATDHAGTVPAEELLRGASIALTHAKDAGGDCARRFSPEMFASLAERASLEEDLRGGLLRGELVPYYQPIVALASRRVVRFEALVRWRHPQRGLLAPDSFLPIAEDVGLNDDLLYAMFRQSCRDAHEWGGGTGLALNMSPWQVCEPHIASRLLRIVFASGLRPDRLTVEITENAVMHDVAAAQATVAALREAGIKVALDDFGSGYASLSRMCKIPLDMIKIDRTLVQSLDSDAGRKLVKVVVDLGQSLAMPVTAEGIETEQQARYLADLGCTFGQGYLFGRPAPADETAALLTGGLTVPLAC